jgi:hypothetical protein
MRHSGGAAKRIPNLNVDEMPSSMEQRKVGLLRDAKKLSPPDPWPAIRRRRRRHNQRVAAVHLEVVPGEAVIVGRGAGKWNGTTLCRAYWRREEGEQEKQAGKARHAGTPVLNVVSNSCSRSASGATFIPTSYSPDITNNTIQNAVKATSKPRPIFAALQVPYYRTKHMFKIFKNPSHNPLATVSLVTMKSYSRRATLSSLAGLLPKLMHQRTPPKAFRRAG